MSAAMGAAIQASSLQPALLVQLTFQSNVTVYLWTGTGTLSWNSQSWAGLGSLLGITIAEDAATVEARGITVTVSGADPTLLPDCMNDFQLGVPAIVYLGFFSGGSLVASPVVAWAGRMDQPSIDASGTSATIAINCENRLLDMNIAVDRRYTHQDQQMEWPGDLGLLFVDGLQEMTLYWGQYPNSTNNI